MIAGTAIAGVADDVGARGPRGTAAERASPSVGSGAAAPAALIGSVTPSQPVEPGGGSMPSSWMIVGASCRNTGAAAVPPKRSPLSAGGSSIETSTVTCGSSAGKKPTKLA